MDTASIAVIVFIILALSGIVTYLIIDMNRQKQALAAKINSTNVAIQAEKSDRISNVKYVVDQVNEVNDDIYKSINSSIQQDKQNINNLTESHSELVTSMNQFMAAAPSSTAYASGVNHASIPITEHKEVIDPDLRFLKRVSMTKGMTVSDVDFDGGPLNDVKICSKVDPANCLRIPDANGNTTLTSVIPGKAIVLKGNVAVNRDTANVPLHVNGDVSISYGKALHFGAEHASKWKNGTSKAIQCSWDGGNDVLTFFTPGSVSATPKMSILSNGRVGVNIAKPIALMHLDYGKTNQTLFTASRIDAGGNKACFSVAVADAHGLVSLMGGAYSDNGTQKYFGKRGASKIALHDGLIAFYTGNTVGVEGGAVTWSHTATMLNGNFGVGTMDPKRKLHVAGKMWVGDVTRNDWNSAMVHVINKSNPGIALEQFGHSTTVLANRTGTTTLGGQGPISLQTGLFDPNGSGGKERVRIQTDGKVGVNVTTPLTTLDVGGATTIRGTARVGYGVGRNDANIEVGAGRGADGHAYVDLISDASTYQDFGARFIRTPGVNANTHLMHRGTGLLEIMTMDNGAIMIRTSAGAKITLAGEKVTVEAAQSVEIIGNLTVRGNITATGTVQGSR